MFFYVTEFVTEVCPMTYNDNAATVVSRVYVYMSVINRSISSIEVFKYAASILVNLARYRITGPKIYDVRTYKMQEFTILLIVSSSSTFYI